MVSTPAARIHVESPQTAVPARGVEPRGQTRSIAVAAPPLSAAALQRRARVVLYYREAAAAGGDSAAPAERLWEEAVWAKEALNQTLPEHPEMAGRLRRRAEDGSCWEVKLNDAGARFVHATADATFDEFLAAAGDADRARSWEAALAPWFEVKAEEPDVCALLYMQVTRFHGDGGFAVGVSCSLMLCDPLSMARFLRSWARAYAKLKAQNEVATHPSMQYARYFRRPDAMAVRALTKSTPLDAFAADGGATETVLFRARPTGGGGGGAAPDDHHRALAAACVGQASGGSKAPPRLSVVVPDADGRGGTSIETVTAAADGQPGGGAGEWELEAAQWRELGLEELVLRASAGKPARVSYSIVNGGGDDEGLVVVMPDSDGASGGLLVTATVPKY